MLGPCSPNHTALLPLWGRRFPGFPYFHIFAFMTLTAAPMGLLSVFALTEGDFKGIKFIQTNSSEGCEGILNN